MIGYAPFVQVVHAGTGVQPAMRIGLQPSVYEMDNITVTSRRNRRWKKQLASFTKGVIGETTNAAMTSILNPEVLDFTQRNDILLARASEPLVIENNALGYRIYYSLIHCIVQDQRYQFKGVARFEEMEPRNRREMRKMEAKSYPELQRFFKAFPASPGIG